jgi:hypothetical protein
MEFVAILREFGPLAGAVIFFMWRDWRREDRSTTRIEKLEDEMREVILPLVGECNSVIAQNTAVMQRLESILEDGQRGKQES